jgi:hypothetical protein
MLKLVRPSSICKTPCFFQVHLSLYHNLEINKGHGTIQIDPDVHALTLHEVISLWDIWKLYPQFSEDGFQCLKQGDDGNASAPASFSKVASIGLIASLLFAIQVADSEFGK